MNLWVNGVRLGESLVQAIQKFRSSEYLHVGGPTTCGFVLPDPKHLGYAAQSVLNELLLIVGTEVSEDQVGQPTHNTETSRPNTPERLTCLKQPQ
jgi:hypothetical protein